MDLSRLSCRYESIGVLWNDFCSGSGFLSLVSYFQYSFLRSLVGYISLQLEPWHHTFLRVAWRRTLCSSSCLHLKACPQYTCCYFHFSAKSLEFAFLNCASLTIFEGCCHKLTLRLGEWTTMVGRWSIEVAHSSIIWPAWLTPHRK